MNKSNLNGLEFGIGEVLTRSQMKNILGGFLLTEVDTVGGGCGTGCSGSCSPRGRVCQGVKGICQVKPSTGACVCAQYCPG